MRIKNILLIITAITIVSCYGGRKSEAFRVLEDVDSYIEARPDSALAVLEGIDVEDLGSREEKAKYALLMSMALDKNYIDLQSDSIIAPAVKYYRYHGSNEERFLCNYYHARICENAGDHESVLLYAATAESVDTSRVSAENKCMLYAMKGRVYFDARKLQNAIDAYKLACKYSLQAEKYHHYSNYCLMLANVYRYTQDTANTDKYITLAGQFRSYFGPYEIHSYSSFIILSMLRDNTVTQECLDYIDNYIKDYPQYDLIQWHIIAKAYLSAGYPEMALKMLENYAVYYDVSSDIPYYGNLSDVLEELGDYEGALNAQKKFAELVKQEDVRRHNLDIEVVEDNFRNELTQTRQRHLMSYVASISILLICIIIYMTVKWRKERRKNKSDLSELQQEYDALASLKERIAANYQYLNDQITETSDTDQELLRVLGCRIRSLSAFLQKPIPDSLSKVASQIDDLKKNRNYIVDSIGLLYAVTYPDFVYKLRAHDLTSSEIGFCCLYLLGLNIPEAGEVIGKVSGVYNVNSSIRKKLGISGTNLDKWLVKCFAELHPSQICETANVNN